jgi:hypothetical protein
MRTIRRGKGGEEKKRWRMIVAFGKENTKLVHVKHT